MFTRNDLLLKTEHLIDNPLSGEPYHIAFAADQKYLRYIGIALFSILENNPDLPLHFHLFIDDMPAEEAKRFCRLHTKQSQFRISLYYLNNKAFAELQIRSYLSPATYYRIAIPSLLSEQAARVLYLDADILCLGNLTPLLDADLHHHTIGAIHDSVILTLKTLPNENHLDYLEKLGFKADSVYFNAGIMLIDILQWHTRNTNQHLAETINRLNQYVLPLMDQDILNIFFQKNTRLLSERYNWIYRHELDWNNQAVCLIHFTGKHKPWHLPPDTVPIYSNYVSRSPWHDCIYQNPPYLQNTSEYRRYAKYLWRQNRKREAAHYHLQYLLRKIRLIPKAPA